MESSRLLVVGALSIHIGSLTTNRERTAEVQVRGLITVFHCAPSNVAAIAARAQAMSSIFFSLLKILVVF